MVPEDTSTWLHPHANTDNMIPPEEPIKPPSTYGAFLLDEAVVKSLPIPGTKVISSNAYGMSQWGRCARILVELPDCTKITYFLKVSSGPTAVHMCQGEYEGMRSLHAVSPIISPAVYAWGQYNSDPSSYFVLAEFRQVGEQPAEPLKLTARLAELHKNSLSPTGKFGFHTTTCHGTVPQLTDLWEESWAVLYRKQLAHMFAMDMTKHGPWPEFERLCQLILDKVIPRLLEPLQSEGRSIKPCLVHGDLWDENTATDMETGEPLIFDGAVFYGHNEYETGNWRAPRHRLSSRVYIKNYKRNFAVSEPEDDWDGRNLLYSLRFNTGAALLIPGCNQREVVFESMRELLQTYCPEDYKLFAGGDSANNGKNEGAQGEGEEDEEEEEEPEP